MADTTTTVQPVGGFGLRRRLDWLLDAPQAYVFLGVYIALTSLGAF